MTEPDRQFAMAKPAIRSTPSPALSSSPVASPRIQNMLLRRSEFASQREFEIEASKDHWSELESRAPVPQLALTDETDSKKHQFQILARFRRTLGRLLFCWHCANCGAFTCCSVLSCGAVLNPRHPQQQQQGNSHECVELEEAEDSDAEETNRDIFVRIKHQWGGFFSEKWGDNLELGPKIAEGGQAEIFEVEGDGLDSIRMEFVVKAFKKGYSLRSLQTQYPLGTSAPHFPLGNSAIIFAGTILKDDRFAFVMYKYWGDLRKLLDVTMAQRAHSHHSEPPFQEPQAVSIMLQIAKGMELLHKRQIVHRDLKASNILIAFDMRKKPPNPTPSCASSEFSCAIADYECSVGVVGTGFWRAPEILAAVKDQNCCNSSMFTDKADVYSFAMTCYEILTGCVPFENLAATDSEEVLRGLRPQLPHPMNSRITELLCRCWHSNPGERPSFSEIVLALETVKRTSDLANPSSPCSNHNSP